MPKKSASPRRARPQILKIPSRDRQHYKVFTPVVETAKKIPPHAIYLSQLILDMQRGAIDGLVRYLKDNKGIPDPIIARELLRLLDGRPDETRFRLAVIRHPSLPRRTTKQSPRQPHGAAPSELDFKIVARIEELQLTVRKKTSVYLQVENEMKVTPYARRKAVARVESAKSMQTFSPNPRLIDVEHLKKRRATALEKLRLENGKA